MGHDEARLPLWAQGRLGRVRAERNVLAQALQEACQEWVDWREVLETNMDHELWEAPIRRWRQTLRRLRT